MKYFKLSFTYFIQGELTQHIKIGKTNCGIEERMSKLQTGSPDKLNFLGACFGPSSSEAALHYKFKKYRIHGEWFLPSEKIIEFIASNCITNITALYHAYHEVMEGKLTYDEVFAFGDEKLCKRADKAFLEVVEKMYKVNGKSILYAK